MIVFVAGAVFAAFIVIVVLVMLLRRQLREKYAILWLVIGLGLLVLSSFPALLIQLTRALGVEVPSNLIFALSIVLLVGVCLHLSWELSRAEEEVRRLAEEAALLRADVDSIQASLASREAQDEDDSPDAPRDGLDEPGTNTQ